jgi:hypothetical protein
LSLSSLSTADLGLDEQLKNLLRPKTSRFKNLKNACPVLCVVNPT